MNNPVIELSQTLIAERSITPNDKNCQKIITKRLEAIGFTCTSLPNQEVTNLWAQHGKDKPKLCYAGHTDVVPPGDESLWNTPPFEPVIKNGYLFGRGIADMKGSIAAMIIALESVAKKYGQKKLHGMSLLLTSDEEGPAKYGTKVVLEWLDKNNLLPEFCLVGEPSCDKTFGDTVKVGRRGSLHGTLTILGKQGHVAYPEKVKNPIHFASHAISALVNHQWDNGNEHFIPTHLQVTQIHSGTGALNVVPSTLITQFNLRFSPVSTPESIELKTREILDRQNIPYQLQFELGGSPFYTAPQDNPLCTQLLASIKKITGIAPVCKTDGGTSDGRYFAPYNIPVVEFGPNNATIHQINECSSIKELEDLVKVYEDCVVEFLSI